MSTVLGLFLLLLRLCTYVSARIVTSSGTVHPSLLDLLKPALSNAQLRTVPESPSIAISAYMCMVLYTNQYSALLYTRATWISEHSADVRADREDGQSLENDSIDDREEPVGMGVENHPHHHKSKQRAEINLPTKKSFAGGRIWPQLRPNTPRRGLATNWNNSTSRLVMRNKTEVSIQQKLGQS